MARSGLLPRGVDFADRLAPDLRSVEAIAEGVYRGLPDHVQALTAGVIIRVSDFPTADMVEELDLDTEFDLLGLFIGSGLAQTGGQSHTGMLPNEIWLFRRPILDYWAGSEETLQAIIAHVLVHEIGHHYGLSDADMERIEANAS